jgi:hypothetical protein
MDAPIESVNEAPAIDGLQDTGMGDSFESFETTLQNAFNSLDKAANGVAEQEEPTEEKAVEEEVSDYSEPFDDLSEDVGDDWTPKAANRFKQLKTELKTSVSELEQLRQEKVQYESQIKELTGLAESKDVEQLQVKLAEFEKKQMFSDLENTTAYKQAVTEPLAQLLQQSEQIAEKYDVTVDALLDIISLTDPDLQQEQLAELLPNASDRDKAKIYNIMEAVVPIFDRRSKLFEQSAEALAEAKMLEEQTRNAEAAERFKLRQNVTRNVVERVESKLPFLKGIEGLDLSAIREKAASVDPTAVHPVDFAYNAVSAQILPAVVREYASLRKEVETLTDRLAEYEDAEPKMSGSQPSSKRMSQKVGGDASFEDRVNAAFSSL